MAGGHPDWKSGAERIEVISSQESKEMPVHWVQQDTDVRIGVVARRRHRSYRFAQCGGASDAQAESPVAGELQLLSRIAGRLASVVLPECSLHGGEGSVPLGGVVDQR